MDAIEIQLGQLLYRVEFSESAKVIEPDQGWVQFEFIEPGVLSATNRDGVSEIMVSLITNRLVKTQHDKAQVWAIVTKKDDVYEHTSAQRFYPDTGS